MHKEGITKSYEKRLPIISNYVTKLSQKGVQSHRLKRHRLHVSKSSQNGFTKSKITKLHEV